MKERLASIVGSILALPWCCIIPGILSVAGLAGVALARSIAVGFAPFLLLLSVLFLGRAHYLIHIKRQGNRLSRIIVWLSTLLALTLWAVRWRLL